MTTELEAIKTIGDNIEQFKAAHQKEVTTLKKQVEELKSEVQIQKDAGYSPANRQLLVDKSSVENFIKETFKDGSKTNIKASMKLNPNVVFKSAEIMTSEVFFTGSGTTTPDVFTGRAIDPTLYQRRRKRNLILDHIPIENVSEPYLYYQEKKEVSGDEGSSVDVGGATWVTSAGQKNQRSFRVSSTKVESKKVAVFGTVADKLLRDVASLNNWLREDLTDEVLEEYNDALLNSDGTGTEPLGLKENAVAFTVTNAFDSKIVDPNLVDVIVAFCASMREAKEEPGKVLLSSDNYFSLFVIKDNQSRYQNANMVYVTNRGQVYVAGVPVFAVDSEDIASTHIMVLAQDPGFKIKNYNSLIFERGLNGEDFRFDRTSYRCFQEVLSYIPEHRYNSVMYDTIANVLGAIEYTS